MERVSREKLHQLTGLTHRTITKRLQAAAVEPLERDGRSDLFDSEVALRAILLDPEADNGRPDLAHERALLAREQSAFYRIKNAALQGTLVPVVEVDATWQRLVYTVRAKLLALPHALTPQVLGLDDPAAIDRLLTDYVHETLNELADHGDKPTRK